MKIFVNEQYEILSIDREPKHYTNIFEIELTREEMFGRLCDTVIQGYKYEQNYELLFDKKGSNARDEKTGEVLYKLDEGGNKISTGYACYPFVDYNTLLLIQKQYEDSQKQVQVLSSQIDYLSMMSGIETEVDHE